MAHVWKLRRVAAVGAALAGLGALASGCSASEVLGTASDEPDRPGPHLVVLGDASTDQSDGGAFARAVEAVAGEAADARGRVDVATFQRNALATIDWPISQRFAIRPGIPAGNSTLVRADLEAQAKDVATGAAALLRDRSAKEGTDVVGALLAAADRVRSVGWAGPRVVVLVSNAIAVSDPDRLNLKKRAQLTDSGIAKAIQRLRKNDKIADLSGVCVVVVGAGQDDGATLPTTQQLGLRKFWERYLRAANAREVVWEARLDGLPACASDPVAASSSG